MIRVVQQSEATVRKIANTYEAANFITKDFSQNLSLAVNKAENHSETEFTDYDRIYYVLEGILNIKLGNESFTVSAGDACFASSGTAYEFFGTFRAVVVNQPAFGTKS